AVTGELPAYRFTVISINGSVIAELTSERSSLHIGRNVLRWNGRGRNNERVPEGMYFYRLSILDAKGEREYNGKLVLNH
ncbi:MAG: hypothetical protein M3Y60_07365, partial [Bacteroidota bacterium]|nr:hypothetical protein [Bacteroidota bacterium]